MKIIKTIIITILLGVFAASCSPSDSPKQNTNSNSENASFKETVSFTDIDGKEISLSGLEGKVVIVDFWASWCPPCKASIPFYNRMYEKYSEKGLVIIGADVNEETQVIRTEAEKLGIKYIVAQPNEEMNMLFKVSSIPSMFLFDKNGNLVNNQVGYSGSADKAIEQMILEELNK